MTDFEEIPSDSKVQLFPEQVDIAVPLTDEICYRLMILFVRFKTLVCRSRLVCSEDRLRTLLEDLKIVHLAFTETPEHLEGDFGGFSPDQLDKVTFKVTAHLNPLVLYQTGFYPLDKIFDSTSTMTIIYDHFDTIHTIFAEVKERLQNGRNVACSRFLGPYTNAEVETALTQFGESYYFYSFFRNETRLWTVNREGEPALLICHNANNGVQVSSIENVDIPPAPITYLLQNFAD